MSMNPDKPTRFRPYSVHGQASATRVSRHERWEIYSPSGDVHCISEQLVLAIRDIDRFRGHYTRYKRLPMDANAIVYRATRCYHVITMTWTREITLNGALVTEVLDREVRLRKRGDEHDDVLPMRIKADQI